MKIAVLGPDGSFTAIAAKKYVEENKLDAELFYQKTIFDLFEPVKRNKADLAVIPLENSLSGTIVEALDRIYSYDLKIIDEIIIPIHHCLISLKESKKIEKIISHPQAIAQCLSFIQKRYPKAEIENASSTSEAISKLQQYKVLNAAAIARKEIALNPQFKILNENIEDNEFNTTRFVVVSKQQNHNVKEPKTTIVIIPNKDMPGLLHSLLGEFATRGINLNKIESRPSRLKMGEYIFYIDFIGSVDDIKVKECIESLRKKAEVKILGTYQNRLK